MAAPGAPIPVRAPLTIADRKRAIHEANKLEEFGTRLMTLFGDNPVTRDLREAEAFLRLLAQ